MIIFDLDGTLADCEHRRHFVDASKRKEAGFDDVYHKDIDTYDGGKGWYYKDKGERTFEKKFEPDWRSFYESCSEDKPIDPVIHIFRQLLLNREEVEIWSGRCDSVRAKTLAWIDKHIFLGNFLMLENIKLKMRPQGNHMCDELLKEKWLKEAQSSGKTIDMVFDDRPKVVRMWRSNGIFVFDVNQDGKEF